MGSITVNLSGPVFDGRAAAAAAEFCDRVVYDVASQGYSNVMHNLEGSIRHPTPYYETQITIDGGGRRRVINDRGIIYGPWLEGVGSRNAPVTIFPGYHSFRRATEELRGQVEGLAERRLSEYIRRMQ